MMLDIISWNINSFPRLNNNEKWNELNKLINLEPDLLLLQETKINAQEFSVITHSKDIKFPNGFNSLGGYSGTITFELNSNSFSHRGIIEHIINGYDRYNHGRILISILDNPKICVFNVYIPNSGTGLIRMDFKYQFMTSLTNIIKSYQDKGYSIIVAGDVNVAPFQNDLKNYASNHNKTPGCTDQETSFYQDLLFETGLIDVANSLELNSDYTFFTRRFGPKAKLNNVGWRLDHFWISSEFKIVHYQVLKDIEGSDHVPIRLKVEL